MRIKFENEKLLIRLNGIPYTGILEYFILWNKDPRTSGVSTELVKLVNKTVTNGVLDFGQEDLDDCPLCTGSINDLVAGNYYYSLRSADGVLNSVYPIQAIEDE